MDNSFQRFLTDAVVVCPNCLGSLRVTDTSELLCVSCGCSFQIVDGMPILLPSDSVFTAEQILLGQNTFFADRIVENRLKKKIRQSLPALAVEYTRDALDQLLKRQLPQQQAQLLGLIVGVGEKLTQIACRFPGVTWITTDVDLAYRPQLIADAVGLPLADNSIDIVIAEQVLEHVIDIEQAARELQRVCKTGGVLLIKIPFCFPWHGIPIDFYRCTPSGIRALFRSTETIHIGQTTGAWGALAYQLDSRCVHLATFRILRMLAAFISRFLFGWLKWLDRFSLSNNSSLITSASITFIGRKRHERYTAREILQELQGLYGSGAI